MIIHLYLGLNVDLWTSLMLVADQRSPASGSHLVKPKKLED
jgi:hypothetical protein